jgi:hypothetical protein
MSEKTVELVAMYDGTGGKGGISILVFEIDIHKLKLGFLPLYP